LSGHRDEDGNKGDGDDGEAETEDTRESLDKENDEEYGTDRNFETTDVPTKEEVKAAVDKLQNKMAPGPVGIPSEMLKKGYKNRQKKFCDLIE